jgi:DNA-binding PadR family transcriptional regulator
MKIGNNEKIIFSLIKKYPHLTTVNLHVLFTMLTHRKININRMFLSLRIKGLLDEKNRLTKNSSIDEHDVLVEIDIDKDILDNLQALDEFIKLGNTAKSLLYVISKVKKASLQFLVDLFDKSERSTYAVLQRLEQKNLVYSYNSKIYHLNTLGRRYSPKYYVITDVGRIMAKIKSDKIDHERLDRLLEKTQNEIESMHKIFHSPKT